MGNLLTTIALIISMSVVSQHTQIKLYVPIRTYHFDRTPDYQYVKDEGGNLGAVVVYRRIKKKWFRDINAGVFRNSFGKAAVIAQYGIGRRWGKLNTSFNVGLISGYNTLFDSKTATLRFLPNILKDNGVIPAINSTLSYDFGLVSPLITITPEYLNAGILLTLK